MPNLFERKKLAKRREFNTRFTPTAMREAQFQTKQSRFDGFPPGQAFERAYFSKMQFRLETEHAASGQDCSRWQGLVARLDLNVGFQYKSLNRNVYAGGNGGGHARPRERNLADGADQV